MACNLQPLKVPEKKKQPFVCLKCEAYEFISNRQYQHSVQSLSILQHLSISHPGKKRCRTRRGKKANFFKKSSKVFSTCTLTNIKRFYPNIREKKCTIQLARSFFFFFLGLSIHCIIKSNQSYLSVQSTQQNFESSCHFKLKRKQCSFWASENWASFHAAQGSSLCYFHKSTLVKVQLIQNCSDSISCQLNPAMYLRQGHISARYSDRKTLSDHPLHKGSYQLLQHQLLGKVGKNRGKNMLTMKQTLH